MDCNCPNILINSKKSHRRSSTDSVLKIVDLKLIKQGSEKLPLDVVVKEIYVQTCLNTTANINHPVVFVMQLVIGSVHPVHYVQSPISA
jgi:hypothetical protein